MRGKLVAAVRRVQLRRIIPARAGQTAGRTSRTGRPPDHPRACGANETSGWFFLASCGSSPRVRGKPTALRQARRATRIIPARAGQTATGAMACFLIPDHPRACGANAPRNSFTPYLLRIIPARAGQTTSGCATTCRPADHPRACGANGVELARLRKVPGSSPRVRGKQVRAILSEHHVRIIPARAGQTVGCR